MAIKNVIIVGANGKLGQYILRNLLEAKSFTVTVLTRKSSKSTYPSEVSLARVSDDLPSDELVEAFRGQDALVICFTGSMEAEALKVIDAAAEAGVKRVIPPDFGSMDSSDLFSQDLIPYYSRKVVVREHLQQLATEGALSWTSIVPGHFFDFGLHTILLAVDVPKRTSTIFDGGDIKWSVTRESTIGLATAKVLQHEEKYKNRMVYIQSLALTQNELQQSLDRVVGEKFKVEHVSSDEYIKERKALLDSKGMDPEVIEELVSVGGIVHAYWENKNDFVNEELGLPTENLDDMVRDCLKQKSWI